MGKPQKRRLAAAAAASAADAAAVAVPDGGDAHDSTVEDEIMKKCTWMKSVRFDAYCMHPNGKYSVSAIVTIGRGAYDSDTTVDASVYVDIRHVRTVYHDTPPALPVWADPLILVGASENMVIRAIASGDKTYNDMPLPKSIIGVVERTMAQLHHFNAINKDLPADKQHATILERYEVLTIAVKTKTGYVLALVRIHVRHSSADTVVAHSPVPPSYITLSAHSMGAIFEVKIIEQDVNAIRNITNVATRRDIEFHDGSAGLVNPHKGTVKWPWGWKDRAEKVVLSAVGLVWSDEQRVNYREWKDSAKRV